MSMPAGELRLRPGQAGISQGDVFQRHVEDRGAAAVDGHLDLRLGKPHHPGHGAQNQLLGRVGRIQVVRRRASRGGRTGPAWRRACRRRCCAGAWVSSPALARAWAVGRCRGGCTPHWRASGVSPSRSRIWVASSTWKSWPLRRPGKQGQLRRPEPEGRRGAGGEDGQGLKGLGQGAHADPGLGVAQADGAGCRRHPPPRSGPDDNSPPGDPGLLRLRPVGSFGLA